MITVSRPVSHYAKVEMHMQINGLSLGVAQLGPEFIILDQFPPSMPPGSAEIVLMIDGKEDCFTVHLPAGLVEDQKRTPIKTPDL